VTVTTSAARTLKWKEVLTEKGETAVPHAADAMVDQVLPLALSLTGKNSVFDYLDPIEVNALVVGFVEGEDAVVLALRKKLRQCTCDVLMSMPVR
jgi:hypothetical protein